MKVIVDTIGDESIITQYISSLEMDLLDTGRVINRSIKIGDKEINLVIKKQKHDDYE